MGVVHGMGSLNVGLDGFISMSNARDTTYFITKPLQIDMAS
jgi:hypothetical protein